MKNIGLIVNPLAGMGGPAGMKGSDRAECVIRARELGIKPIAYGRAEDVLVTEVRGYGRVQALYCTWRDGGGGS